MIIDESTYDKGLNAMMYATFFYYQLLAEGSFSCGQTSYWLWEDYTCWELLDITLNEPVNVSFGIDENFLREAAVVYILCMLANTIYELDEDEFLRNADSTINTLKTKGLILIPEVSRLLDCLPPVADKIILDKYRYIMNEIFNKYVRGRFARLIAQR